MRNNSYLLLAFVLFILFSFITIKKLEREVAYEQIIVAEGDTLWAYAKEYAEGVPTEKWIDEIMNVNHLSSATIQTGKKLKIPVFPKKEPYNDIATNVTGE